MIPVVGSVLALRHVHREMSEERGHEIRTADLEYGALASQLRELDPDAPQRTRAQLQKRLTDCAERWREPEAIPTWPFDRTRKRRLAGIAALLAAPLISQAIGLLFKHFSPS